MSTLRLAVDGVLVDRDVGSGGAEVRGVVGRPVTEADDVGSATESLSSEENAPVAPSTATVPTATTPTTAATIRPTLDPRRGGGCGMPYPGGPYIGCPGGGAP
ncbi:hypothetical protein [Embleya sp. NPDC005575]|uniref:hypothetical protein n=1 Tax=Embleya sp. NPDC005575 TaxID=3156892 RepID=UPI0033A1666F